MASTAPHFKLAHGVGFWAVAFAFLLVMGYCAVPTPLYGLYAARDGFGSLTITFVFAAYAVGVVVSLFTVGHLSDFHGRRRVLIPALLTAVASAVIFLLWRALPGLILARFVSGLAVGAVTATATAWLAELHAIDRPSASARRTEIVGASANLGGIGLGPLVAGVLAQWVPAPLSVSYLVYGGLMLVAVLGLLLTPETRVVPAHERPAYRPQQMHAPQGMRAPFFAALGAGFVAFATFALFTSLAPTFLAGPLQHTSLALAGFTAFLVFGAAAVAQLAFSGRTSRTLVLIGSGALLVGSIVVVLSVWLASPSLALFLIGGTALGTGAGTLFKGAMTTIIRIAEPARRAQTLVSLFLAAYLGMVLPSVGLGVLTQEVQPKLALLIFAGMLVTGVLAGLGPLLRAERGGAVAHLRVDGGLEAEQPLDDGQVEERQHLGHDRATDACVAVDPVEAVEQARPVAGAGAAHAGDVDAHQVKAKAPALWHGHGGHVVGEHGVG
jgi:MFS family permease